MSKTETQSEALRLANELQEAIPGFPEPTQLEAAAAAELLRLEAKVSSLECASKEWHEKTDWVRNTIKPRELGMHRADVLRARIEALDAENKALRTDAERYRWLRAQPDDCSAPRIDICHWTCEEGDSVSNGDGLRGEVADQAIDAAMASQRRQKAADMFDRAAQTLEEATASATAMVNAMEQEGRLMKAPKAATKIGGAA